jgi:magnesium transporter
MAHHKRKRRIHRPKPVAPGTPPGTLIRHADAVVGTIRVIGYGPDAVESESVERVADLETLRGRHPVVWVRVQGLADIDAIRAIGEIFELHSLALEDIVNTHQRSKLDEYDDHFLIIARMPSATDDVHTEQLAIVLGDGYVLSFEERPSGVLDHVEGRLPHDGSRIRTNGADYLASCLIDVALDRYFPVLEHYGEIVEELEDILIKQLAGRASVGTDGRLATQIHDAKRDLLALRRTIWPAREMLGALSRSEGRFISDRTRLYLRDSYDHAIQLMDLVDTYRDIASGLVDVYLSSLSTRMNEVMKTLTIIATIFMPLGFIAGLYGMNFDPSRSPWNMPELEWRFGYLFALAVMCVVVGTMLLYFRRNGWLGGRSDADGS